MKARHPIRDKSSSCYVVVFVVFLLGLACGPAVVVMAEGLNVKLDCSVYETKETNFGVGFKVGQFIFKVGPEVNFTHRTGVAWDKVVHGTIARYVELCNRYNAGLVTKAEYEDRLREIEALYKETQEMEAKLYEATRQRAKAAGHELDEALGRKSVASQTQTNAGLEASVEQLAERIEQLEPIGRPLKPKRPCAPPDMLGAPGRSC